MWVTFVQRLIAPQMSTATNASARYKAVIAFIKVMEPVILIFEKQMVCSEQRKLLPTGIGSLKIC